MKALRLIGAITALAAAKLWLSATVPWFVALGLLVLAVWMMTGFARGRSGRRAR
jgi:hypothetical protein